MIERYSFLGKGINEEKQKEEKENFEGTENPLQVVSIGTLTGEGLGFQDMEKDYDISKGKEPKIPLNEGR